MSCSLTRRREPKDRALAAPIIGSLISVGISHRSSLALGGPERWAGETEASPCRFPSGLRLRRG